MARLGAPLRRPTSCSAALAHRSFCAENPGHVSNERLEFLGDAVLGMVVTDHVFRTHETLDEGVLTEIRKTMVNSVTLAEVATELGIGDHLLLGRGEELSGGRAKPSILADALEAVIGATYLHGGFEAAQRFVLHILGDRAGCRPPSTARTTRAASRSSPPSATAPPPATVVDASGPDHARTFDVEVVVEGQVLGRGEGRSKKQAEQAAARAAWAVLVEDEPAGDEARHHRHRGYGGHRWLSCPSSRPCAERSRRRPSASASSRRRSPRPRRSAATAPRRRSRPASRAPRSSPWTGGPGCSPATSTPATCW
jgi:ribonuclease III